MKKIDRYVSSQVLVSSLFAIAVLSFVIVLGNIFKRLLDLLVNHDVPLDFILGFVACMLPFSLTFTIPWGFLTAVLLTFGRLSADNELTAMRTSGLSMPRVAASVVGLAVVLSLVCLYINVEIAPRAETRMRESLYEMATSNPIALFGNDEVIDEFPGKKIYVGRKDGNRLENLFVFELDDRGIPMRTIHARRGELVTEGLGANGGADPAAGQIRLRLSDARFEQRDENEPRDLRRIQHGAMEEGGMAISLKALYEKNQRRRGLSSMTLAELRADLKRGQAGEKVTATRTEVSKRFSFSMACLAFGLIAVPLGITAQRRETSIGFALSLAIAFVYFLFIIIADTFRHNAAAYPEFLIWLPNLVFVGVGVILFWRLAKK